MLATNIANTRFDYRCVKIASTISVMLVALSFSASYLAKALLRSNSDALHYSFLAREDNIKEIFAEASTPFLFTNIDAAHIEKECRAAILTRDGILEDKFNSLENLSRAYSLYYKINKSGTMWLGFMQRIRAWWLFQNKSTNRNNCIAKILGCSDDSQPPGALTAEQLGIRDMHIFFCMKSLTVYTVFAGHWARITCPVPGSDILHFEKRKPPQVHATAQSSC